VRYCGQCGATIAQGNSFCGHCGAPFTAPSVPIQAAAKPNVPNTPIVARFSRNQRRRIRRRQPPVSSLPAHASLWQRHRTGWILFITISFLVIVFTAVIVAVASGNASESGAQAGDSNAVAVAATDTPRPAVTATSTPDASTTTKPVVCHGLPPAPTIAPIPTNDPNSPDQTMTEAEKDALPVPAMTARGLHLDKGSCELPAPQGQIYVDVHIDVVNEGSSEARYKFLDFNLQGASGQTYTPSMNDNVGNTTLGEDVLEPGQSANGDLSFLVPTSDTTGTFSMSYQQGGQGTAVDVPIK